MLTSINRLCVLAALGVMLGAAALPPAGLVSAGQRGPLVVTPSVQPPTPTDTPLPTATPTAPPTITPSVPATATPSAQPTITPSVLATATPSAAATATPPTPAATESPTAVPSAQATATPRPTREPDPDSANPQITKQVDRAEARVGDELVFTILVTNPEPRDAEDVVVTDRLPSYFDPISAESSRGTVTVSGRTVSVDLGTLPSGDEVRIVIRVRLNDQAPEELSNQAQLVTSSATNNTDDDRASAQLRRIGGSAGSQPSATPTPGPPGQSPTAGAGGTPAPGAPTGTPGRPRGLPNTGAPEPPYLALLALGWGVLAGSLILRRRARRGS